MNSLVTPYLTYGIVFGEVKPLQLFANPCTVFGVVKASLLQVLKFGQSNDKRELALLEDIGSEIGSFSLLLTGYSVPLKGTAEILKSIAGFRIVPMNENMDDDHEIHIISGADLDAINSKLAPFQQSFTGKEFNYSTTTSAA